MTLAGLLDPATGGPARRVQRRRIADLAGGGDISLQCLVEHRCRRGVIEVSHHRLAYPPFTSSDATMVSHVSDASRMPPAPSGSVQRATTGPLSPVDVAEPLVEPPARPDCPPRPRARSGRSRGAAPRPRPARTSRVPMPRPCQPAATSRWLSIGTPGKRGSRPRSPPPARTTGRRRRPATPPSTTRSSSSPRLCRIRPIRSAKRHLLAERGHQRLDVGRAGRPDRTARFATPTSSPPVLLAVCPAPCRLVRCTT